MAGIPEWSGRAAPGAASATRLRSGRIALQFCRPQSRKRPGLNRELPPGYESLAWVPNSSTLIYGERDAVLVDTFLTAEATRALADWVIARTHPSHTGVTAGVGIEIRAQALLIAPELRYTPWTA